jgi:hypothetical protein
MSMFSRPGRSVLAALSAVVLSAAGVLVLGASPASAATTCAGTIGLEFSPGLTLDGQDITVSELGNDGEAGTMTCALPALTTLTVKDVHVEIYGSCVASALKNDPTQPPTAILDYGDAAQDSVLDIASVVSTFPASGSKQIVLRGTVRAGDPHGGETGALTVTSTGNTTDCTTEGGLTSFTGATTLALL